MMEDASTLVEFVKSALSCSDYSIRSYCGRGRSSECLAIRIDDDEKTWDLAMTLAQADHGKARQLGCPSIDNMGRGYVVYFPRVPYSGADDEDDDDGCGY